MYPVEEFTCSISLKACELCWVSDEEVTGVNGTRKGWGRKDTIGRNLNMVYGDWRVANGRQELAMWWGSHLWWVAAVPSRWAENYSDEVTTISQKSRDVSCLLVTASLSLRDEVSGRWTVNIPVNTVWEGCELYFYLKVIFQYMNELE